MSEIKNIVLHFTNSAALTRENLEMAKKSAFLNLKFELNNQLNIANKFYSKNDLIKIFDFYQSNQNLEILNYLERNTVFLGFNDFYKPTDFIKKMEDFEEMDTKLSIRQYLTETFSDNFFQAIFFHNKNQNLKELYILTSYLYYFKDHFKFRIIDFLKQSYSAKMEKLVADKYTTTNYLSYKNHFLFHPYFIRMMGKISEDDQDYLADIIHVTYDFFHHNLIFEDKYLSTLREHFYINNSVEVKMWIRDTLNSYTTPNYFKADPNSKVDYKYIWITVGILALIFTTVGIIFYNYYSSLKK